MDSYIEPGLWRQWRLGQCVYLLSLAFLDFLVSHLIPLFTLLVCLFVSLFILCACMWGAHCGLTHSCEARLQLEEDSSHLPPCGFWRLNFWHKALAASSLAGWTVLLTLPSLKTYSCYLSIMFHTHSVSLSLILYRRWAVITMSWFILSKESRWPSLDELPRR